MSTFISISSNELRMDSGLTESAFGKTNLAQFLTTDKGLLVKFRPKVSQHGECDDADKYGGKHSGGEFDDNAKFGDNGKCGDCYRTNKALGTSSAEPAAASGLFQESPEFVKFSPWTFSHIEADKDSGHAIFCGQIPSSNEDPLRKNHNIFLIIVAMTEALKRSIDVPAVGLGGILAGNDYVLFLPEIIFENCTNALSKEEKALTDGVYKFKGLLGAKAVYFTRAVIVYEALAKKLPFARTEEEKRQKDIIDGLFLPLKYAVFNIDKTLAAAVDEALSPNKVKNTEFQENFPIEILKKELGTDGGHGKPDGKITESANGNCKQETGSSVFSLDDAGNAESTELKEFERDGKLFFEKLNKKIKFKRAVHKNKGLIAATAIALIVTAFASADYAKRLNDLPTTKGLTAAETVNQFYAGIHSLDSELIKQSCKGSEPTAVLNSVSTIYVTVKARSAYDGGDTYTPERWVNIVLNPKHKGTDWMYGLSHLVMHNSNGDTLPTDLYPKIIKRNEKPGPVKEDGGIPQEGAQKNFLVSYYKILTSGENPVINVDKIEDLVQCSFIKDRWLVTGIRTEILESSEFETAPVIEDLKNSLSKTDDGSVIADEQKTYPWLPDEKTVYAEKERMKG
ncbi:hypothetical protein HRQ91_03095 [Treponema parvum]|uniref:Uncharacterized protein n=1 Tax=Treponema parvum TaxID=138851 RepID=A0A975F3V5_9SPIR|nr:hypothetical protein [Treponema parvum]QTQ13524.1 hypothetical protein HRQ91_03095 [Treponema parvum]